MQSLFDRILDPESHGVVTPQDSLTRVATSIERELNSLLNTRSYLGGIGVNAKGTILDYGLDSIVSAGGASIVSGKLESVLINVRKAIEQYEPRLSHVNVTGEYQDNSPTKLLLRVNARLRQTHEPIQYKIPLTVSESEA